MKRIMLTTAKFLPLLVITLPLAWAGCGGDDEIADEGPEQDDRQLSALTDGELVAVCDDLRQVVDQETQVTAFAHMNCLALETVYPTCDDARLDQCVQAQTEQPPENARVACFPLEFEADDCNATVADYAACYEDTVRTLSGLTCASLQNRIPLPASCEPIRADCPNGLILSVEQPEEQQEEQQEQQEQQEQE